MFFSVLFPGGGGSCWSLDYGPCCLRSIGLCANRFGDMRLQNPDSKSFVQMFRTSYAGKILECHLNLLNMTRAGGYLPDRVVNLIFQYLSNRFVIFASGCVRDYFIYVNFFRKFPLVLDMIIFLVNNVGLGSPA